MPKVLAGLQQGLISNAHQDFVEKLAVQLERGLPVI